MPRVFRSTLVLRIGSAHGVERGQSNDMKDVRRILTVNPRRPVANNKLSEDKMMMLVNQFIKQDLKAESETMLAMLNESVASELSDAWSLNRTKRRSCHWMRSSNCMTSQTVNVS